MPSPVYEGAELHKGFQTSTRQTIAMRRATAGVTLLMTGGLMLATIIVMVTVSIEVVKAAALH